MSFHNHNLTIAANECCFVVQANNPDVGGDGGLNYIESFFDCTILYAVGILLRRQKDTYRRVNERTM